MTDLQTSEPGLLPSPVAPKLDVVATVRTTWRVFAGQPWRFLWLILLPVLSAFAAQLVAGSGVAMAHIVAGKDSPVTLAVTMIFTVAAAVVQYGTQFTCHLGSLWGAVRSMEGGRFTTGEALRAGFGRLLPYVGLGIVALLILLVGFVLLIVPAIIAGVFLSVAPAACVIERRGPIKSLKRSVALVRGNWWRCFGTLLLAIPVPLFVSGLIVLLAYLVFASLGVRALALLPGPAGDPRLLHRRGNRVDRARRAVRRPPRLGNKAPPQPRQRPCGVSGRGPTAARRALRHLGKRHAPVLFVAKTD